MYILNQHTDQIIDSAFVQRFAIAEKPDAVLIVASYCTGNNMPPVTLGRYKDRSEAMDALHELFRALTQEQNYYTMPDSLLYAEEHIRKDARVKRRGGS